MKMTRRTSHLISKVLAGERCSEFDVDLGSNFLADNARNRNIVIGQRYVEISFYDELIFSDSNFGLDNSRLLLSVNIELTFSPHGVSGVVIEANLFDDLAAKRRFGVPAGFHIVIVKMLALKVCIEALERGDQYGECKLVGGGVYDPLRFGGSRFDELEFGIRSKAHFAFLNCVLLSDGGSAAEQNATK